VLTPVRLGLSLLQAWQYGDQEFPIPPAGHCEPRSHRSGTGKERKILPEQIEAARQSEQLRTTLIDAMHTNFKTPLTSTLRRQLRGSSKSQQLLENQIELLTIADEDADHLRTHQRH